MPASGASRPDYAFVFRVIIVCYFFQYFAFASDTCHLLVITFWYYILSMFTDKIFFGTLRKPNYYNGCMNSRGSNLCVCLCFSPILFITFDYLKVLTDGTVRETFQSVHQILVKTLELASMKQTGFPAIVQMVTGTVSIFKFAIVNPKS